MKFGWLAFHEAVQPEELVDQAVLAEQVGFDAVFGSDHFHPWVDDQSASGFVWSWFGAVAARTSTVELATSVTCPIFHYHPALIAQAAATIDRLSGGRFFLGVGTGENINSGPMGYAFPGYAERIERMGEALEIMHRLLDGGKVDFTGEHYTVDKAKLYSPPVSRVPILLGAGGPKSATFAGANADGLITSVKDPEVALERVIDPFRKSAAEAGNPDPTVMATRWVVLARDDDEAWRALAPMRGMRAEGRLEAVDPAVLRERADRMDRADVLAGYTIVRDVDELIEAYRPLVTEIGARYVSLQVASVDTVATIELLGREVLPALRAMAAD
ncbi:MAG: TIGR03557 family F420-dependent LLM class oxidoreductase [Actinomycetota bacterium]